MLPDAHKGLRLLLRLPTCLLLTSVFVSSVFLSGAGMGYFG